MKANKVIFLLMLFFVFSSECVSSKNVYNKFYVNKWGAKGDNKTINTIAINKAIDECAAKGGGTVVFPSGIFITGTIVLKSNVSLYLEKGAVIKGSSNLDDYISYVPTKKLERFNWAHKSFWTKALLLGCAVNNVSISGEGIIDGDHLYNPNGEAKMRGPHTIIFGESRNITISGITVVRSANYAFLGYEIENAVFEHVTCEEGWDGIHVRGAKNMIIRNCSFYTGDDAIAGGYWENTVITDCHINSSCNGIRMIMPSSDLTISYCHFEGPGRFPHRRSLDNMNRTNMLAGVLLQPGSWGYAPGNMNKIHIHDLTMDNMNVPFMFVLNSENECEDIVVERVKATRMNSFASSAESWLGGHFDKLVFRDIDIEYLGHVIGDTKNLKTSKPHVGARMLPCWAWYIRNVKQVLFENVTLSYKGEESRPAFIFDNVASAVFNNVNSKLVDNVKMVVLQNSGNIDDTSINVFP